MNLYCLYGQKTPELPLDLTLAKTLRTERDCTERVHKSISLHIQMHAITSDYFPPARMGNPKAALQVIISKLQDVDKVHSHAGVY